jgi:CBS domain-containing protein
MQVKEIMGKNVVTVKRSTTLKQLLQIFSNFHIFPLVPVVDNENILVGIVSFNNLVNAFGPHEPEILRTIPFLDNRAEDIFKSEISEEMGSLIVVDDIMETKVVSIREDASLQEAYKLSRLHLKDEFPVVDNAGKLVGMIGVFDIVREVFRQKGIVV